MISKKTCFKRKLQYAGSVATNRSENPSESKDGTAEDSHDNSYPENLRKQAVANGSNISEDFSGTYRDGRDSDCKQICRVRLFGTPSTGVCPSVQEALVSLDKRTISSASRSRFTGSGDSWSGVRPKVHVICAISENMARETCVASIDASFPTTLQVTKQGNGLAYSETLTYLSLLKPHEILFNEGRRNSQLARKILDLFRLEDQSPYSGVLKRTTRRQKTNADKRAFPKIALQTLYSGKQRAKAAAGDDEQPVVKFVSRGLFDQTKGAALLQSIAREETYEPMVVDEYIILSAAHALIVYLQQGLGASLAMKSLNLTINADGTNRMMIDRASLWQLELLVNSKTGKTENSLVGTIDLTKTSVGARLLRSSLISPPTNVNTINSRLELVDAFLGSEPFFNDVYGQLSRLPSLDTMLAHVGMVQNKVEIKGDEPTDSYVRLASKGIGALISVKTVLAALPAFAHVLEKRLTELRAKGESEADMRTVESGKSSLMVGLGTTRAVPGNMEHNFLLRAIVQVLSEPKLLNSYELIESVFTESTTYSKNPNVRQHQECFALREPVDSFLGVYRKAFLADVDDIYKKADEYAERYGFRVSVRYSSARGYYLTVPTKCVDDLPDEFMNCSRNSRSISFTTKEVAEYNVRARECARDILVMTYDRTQQILAQLRENYDALACLSDAIALLDLCHCFADNVTLSSEPWCRPLVFDIDEPGFGHVRPVSDESKLSDAAVPLLIRNGRFPIATPDYTNESECATFVSNDTFASVDKNFTVISGMNGSGKSTYLKQIAMIVVLAHCGSYVPAEQASIAVRDRLCTRIGNADDQEHSISTFMMEMKETAFICNNATRKSLILLDELGRATSNEEGMSIAWAVAEYLLKKGAITFFVTHFPQLHRLSDTYPTVQNVHLEATIERSAINNIKYSYKVRSGSCSISTDYGVELAVSCAWPTSVVRTARSIESYVQELLPSDRVCETHQNDELERNTQAFHNILDLHSELLALATNTDLDMDEYKEALIVLQRRFAPSGNSALLTRMNELLLRGTSLEPEERWNQTPAGGSNSSQSPFEPRDDKEQSFFNEQDDRLDDLNSSSASSDSRTGSDSTTSSLSTVDRASSA